MKCKPTEENTVITTIIMIDINIAISSKEVLNLSVFDSSLYYVSDHDFVKKKKFKN